MLGLFFLVYATNLLRLGSVKTIQTRIWLELLCNQTISDATKLNVDCLATRLFAITNKQLFDKTFNSENFRIPRLWLRSNSCEARVLVRELSRREGCGSKSRKARIQSPNRSISRFRYLRNPRYTRVVFEN